MGKLFFSQSFDALAKCLADELASDGSSFLQKRWILVPNAPIKQWLSLRLGADSVLAGVKISSVEEALFPEEAPIPTPFEMVCLVDGALREELPPPLACYLEANPRRRGELAEHLGGLFLSYGLHGKSLLAKKGDWQSSLLAKLFGKGFFRLPIQIDGRRMEDPVHCFGFDFLPEIYWEILNAFPHLRIYLFSPCLHFWEDLCSDWERRKLSLFWEKRGASENARKQLENYLEEAPPLLANWGKLGRETLKALDRYPLEVVEAYAPPSEEPSLLRSLQNKIVFFEEAPLPAVVDDSIEIVLTGSSKMNEVEVLRDEILRLAAVHQIPFSEIAVLAPDIQPYVPLIEFLFSGIPYRVANVDVGCRSSFYQGMRRLSALARREWSSEEIIELIETPALYRRQRWDEKKIERFAAWAREAFQSSDWKQGFEKMVYRLTVLFPGPMEKGIALSDADAMEEFLSFLQSLEADLIPMRVEVCRLATWAERFEAWADKYLIHDPEDEADVSAWRAFRERIVDLRKADARLGDIGYSLDVVEPYLNRSCTGPFHGNHLHALRIGSIEPGAILPVRAIFLIGMDEESYPRKRIRSSLDLLKQEAVYVPEKPDIDRYLLLQTLFAAGDFLRISYGHLSPDEGKEVGPSLLIQELMHTLPSTPPSRVAMKQAFDEPMPFRFSIRSPQTVSLAAERTLSLSDLTSFARHPWKHYLQKTEGIYLENRSSKTFALQRSPLLRASLKWPLESVFQRESDVPPALLGKAFLIDLKERAADWQKKKGEWGNSLFSLSFLESAQEMRRTQERIECPPIEIELGEGSRVFLIGEMEHALEQGQGVLHLGDDSLPSVLKAWPALLAASTALGTSRVCFLKNGRIRQIADPKKSLQLFISYYLRCADSLSPLVPDWANVLLRGGAESFETQTEYEDPVVAWLLPRLDIPSPELLFKEWEWLREVFADLIALYPRREAREEV